MDQFPYLEKGRCRITDTINWALYGKINDMDLILNSGFNTYYGDLFGSGENLSVPHGSPQYGNSSAGTSRSTVRMWRPSTERA